MNSQPIDLDQEEVSEEEEPEGAPAVSTTTTDLNVDEETSSQGKASGSGKWKRVLKSKWWQYFEMLPKIEGEDLRCKCKACGITYKAESSMGTGNLRRHILNQCPKQKTSDIAQALLEQGDKSLAIRSQRFNQDIFRELLILAIVKHDLPFQFVEYKAIRSIFTYLEPQVNYFTRNTARTDILKMYKNECNRIAQEMHSCPGKICFTSDLWTSITTDGYIYLTAHFIDSNWVLQKRIINFSYMPPPHSGIALCDKINSLFNVWGIQRKVFTITLDNAAANDVFVGLLRDQLGLNCSLVSTSSASSSSHSGIDDNAYLALNLGSGCMDVLKVLLEFIGRAQKSQLELYLEEPTIDRITKLDVLGFWKAHQFSAMKSDVVEALVCCRDWLAGVKGKLKGTAGQQPLLQILKSRKEAQINSAFCCVVQFLAIHDDLESRIGSNTTMRGSKQWRKPPTAETKLIPLKCCIAGRRTTCTETEPPRQPFRLPRLAGKPNPSVVDARLTPPH
ncbi:hypothetical protein ZIOFF_031896 [Zingiber officinale]|uniref:BED-type domain-containing protein n=1 Tax=Zingiber officinale TaxID=94328 RepID=A0A8J5LAB9_ZINOF|nr:hypothetical protein ZIOFF_031896 [Zingiber officinale]